MRLITAKCSRRDNPFLFLKNDYLPPIDSAEGARQFREQGITAAILIVSMNVEAHLIRHTLESGADGFMSREEILTHLVTAVRHVAAGECFLSPMVQQVLGEG